MMISNRPQAYIKGERATAATARARRFRLLALVLLVILIGAAALWRDGLSGLFWQAAGPLMQARMGGSALEAALASTSAALADRDILYLENLELKARLGRDAGVVRVLGAVLLRPPATPYDTLVIDAGFVQSVAVGDVVSAGGTALIGTITHVYENTARVTLYSAPGAEHQALLRGSIPMTLEGQGGGSLRAQLPAATEASVGDAALLPGIAGGWSATVAVLERGEGDSFVTLYFQVPADIWSLRFVEVWKLPLYDID